MLMNQTNPIEPLRTAMIDTRDIKLTLTGELRPGLPA